MNPGIIFCLIAQTDAWKHLGDRFSGEYLQWRTSDFVGLGLLATGLALGFGLLFVVSKWQEELGRNDRPRSPFGVLARAHGLSRRERGLCLEVAAEMGCADPAELFVRPETAREPLAKRDPELAERLFR